MRSLRGVAVGIIGGGTMGQALIRGLVAAGLSRRQLRVADPLLARRRMLAGTYRVHAERDNYRVARRSDIVILAVKPQQMADVIGELAPYLSRRQLVVSIAAGVTLRWLRARLPRIPVVRVMPNLPATVGCGFSAITLGRTATARDRAMVTTLFSAVGEVVELPERLFDAITAVSGSGPAYVFYLTQIWRDAARRLGLPAAVAEAAVRKTLEGSVRLLAADQQPVEDLVARVASTGGTTEAALRVLARRRVRNHFLEALRAAARRSRELSR